MANCLSEVSFRKSPRIEGYDYGSVNYYFVTICTYEKKCLFYSDGNLNANGSIAQACMEELAEHFRGVRVDKYVIMPNHLHTIIVIERENSANLSVVIGQYKAAVSKRIRERHPDMVVWQRSFHDHVIRDQAGYEKIWNYIDTNPLRWREDCFFIQA